MPGSVPPEWPLLPGLDNQAATASRRDRRGNRFQGPVRTEMRGCGVAGDHRGRYSAPDTLGRGKLPQMVQGAPSARRASRRSAGSWRWARLSCSTSSRAVRNSLPSIKSPQPKQHREELRSLAHLLAQLARPGIARPTSGAANPLVSINADPACLQSARAGGAQGCLAGS